MQEVIYSNGNLECERAKTLLEKLNFQIQEYKLNQHFSARGFVEEFGEEAEYPASQRRFQTYWWVEGYIKLLQGK